MNFAINRVILAVVVLLLAAGAWVLTNRAEVLTEIPLQRMNEDNQSQLQHFSEFNSVFRFSADLPDGWQVEYVPELEALNLSDQVFIRYFEASDFLTLQTVNVLSRQTDTINVHKAVRYEIEKKAGVPDFAHQPTWRSRRHKVVDLRLSQQSPAIFYVFAQNPLLPDADFENFLQGIRFHNDRESYVQPIEQAGKRITKKPFGIFITPETSPVQPDRFTGWHTGVDYEIFDDEADAEIKIFAICGGRLRLKQTAAGYGGVAVQECLFDDEAVTVLYGHLDVASVAANVGDYIAPGDSIGLLGDAFSRETDGARKHLHLSIHKGSATDIRGYIQSEPELSAWLDPENIIQ